MPRPRRRPARWRPNLSLLNFRAQWDGPCGNRRGHVLPKAVPWSPAMDTSGSRAPRLPTFGTDVRYRTDLEMHPRSRHDEQVTKTSGGNHGTNREH